MKGWKHNAIDVCVCVDKVRKSDDICYIADSRKIKQPRPKLASHPVAGSEFGTECNGLMSPKAKV